MGIGTVILSLGILAGIFAVAGISVLGAVCICARKKYAAGKADCIIVLGAKVWPDGRMSNSLVYRCEAALEVWKKGIAPYIIVCGGKGEGEPVAEAHAMGEWFLKSGVPGTAVHLEDASLDTRENLNNARKIMQEMGYRDAVVCTSDYHVARALWLCRDAGIPAKAVSAKSPSTLRSFILGRCREAVSWVLYFFRLI